MSLLFRGQASDTSMAGLLE